MSGGLSDSPPESKVIPLPTRTTCRAPSDPSGRHSRRTRRGGRTEPAPTATRPPKPVARELRLVEHLDGESGCSGDLGRLVGHPGRILDVRRGVDQRARGAASRLRAPARLRPPAARRRGRSTASRTRPGGPGGAVLAQLGVGVARNRPSVKARMPASSSPRVARTRTSSVPRIRRAAAAADRRSSPGVEPPRPRASTEAGSARSRSIQIASDRAPEARVRLSRRGRSIPHSASRSTTSALDANRFVGPERGADPDHDHPGTGLDARGRADRRPPRPGEPGPSGSAFTKPPPMTRTPQPYCPGQSVRGPRSDLEVSRRPWSAGFPGRVPRRR